MFGYRMNSVCFLIRISKPLILQVSNSAMYSKSIEIVSHSLNSLEFLEFTESSLSKFPIFYSYWEARQFSNLFFAR